MEALVENGMLPKEQALPTLSPEHQITSPTMFGVSVVALLLLN
jgi:hypothetical protein